LDSNPRPQELAVFTKDLYFQPRKKIIGDHRMLLPMAGVKPRSFELSTRTSASPHFINATCQQDDAIRSYIYRQ